MRINKRILTALILTSSMLLTACTHLKTTALNGDWSYYGRNLEGQRHATLTQINRSNVEQLKLAWSYQSGIKTTFQATPIVVNGVMYVSLPYNHVVALNAVTGKEIWRYTHVAKADWKMCCGPANRGVAVANGKVFVGTVDARLIALDAKTGNKLWDIDVANADINTEKQSTLSKDDSNFKRKVTGGTGVGINMAPVVFDGKVIVGITGVGYGLHIDNPRADAPLGAVIGLTGLYGRPGFLAAFDVNDGHHIWQFDTIPKQGWEGQFTTHTVDGLQFDRDVAREQASLKEYPNAAQFGGGSAWTTPAIDANTHTLFFGTGNPSPQMNDISRPGDNLYTVSLVALDTNTGKLKWYFQQVPHDLWGYDVASPPVLFDYIKNGQTIAAVGQASKTGWFYIHNRNTGELLLKSEAYVPQKNLFKKPTVEGTVIYPGILGGSNWSPVSVDSQHQSVYVAAMHSPIRYTLHESASKAGEAPIRYAAGEPTKDPRWGLLSAIDLGSGKIKWQHKTQNPLLGGVLSTAGGLVFTGEGDGYLRAYDQDNGNILWSAQSRYGVNAPPISYQVAGKQYIAVVSGGNALFGFAQGDEVLVYALP